MGLSGWSGASSSTSESPEGERQDGGAIDGFGRMRLDAEDVPVEGERRVQVGDGDSDMRDAGEIGHWSLPIG